MANKVYKCSFCGAYMIREEITNIWSSHRYICPKCGRGFEIPKPEHDVTRKGTDDKRD